MTHVYSHTIKTASTTASGWLYHRVVTLPALPTLAIPGMEVLAAPRDAVGAVLHKIHQTWNNP